jgi:hypothetical protein
MEWASMKNMPWSFKVMASHLGVAAKALRVPRLKHVKKTSIATGMVRMVILIRMPFRCAG